MPQTIWIARHGNRQDFADPDWHKTALRPHDPALSADGVVQAKELGQRLVGEGIDYIFASPFLRTIETAHHVAEALDLPIALEEGLSEFLNPDWFAQRPELLRMETLRQFYPRVDPTYRARVRAMFPETGEEALARAGQTAQVLATEFGEDILLIGHGASMLGAAWGLVGGRPEIQCHLCGLVKLVGQKRCWKLELNGDISHLSAAAEHLRFY
ncbi:histidine phosphatase family protein [Synechococcus sp. PCC 7336]|uniref:histidine phosphatase family protein n=1 Tax=Synechococcus sp. PCC 7336 TaxID=195250 RepID=UPI00034561F3|nr:histidine phosphatase family protein [Synechococcus sp. PCC 7336]